MEIRGVGLWAGLWATLLGPCSSDHGALHLRDPFQESTRARHALIIPVGVCRLLSLLRFIQVDEGPLITPHGPPEDGPIPHVGMGKG